MVGPPLQMIPLVKMARGIFLVISVWLWRLPALIRLQWHLQSRRPGIDPFLKTVFQTGLHSLCLEVFESFPFPLGLIVSDMPDPCVRWLVWFLYYIGIFCLNYKSLCELSVTSVSISIQCVQSLKQHLKIKHRK